MTKKIYTFTLENDEYPSEEIKNNLKVIAILMYGELENRDFENPNVILVHNKYLIKNELYETYIGNGYKYSFESERKEFNSMMYEPLILNSNSFGITVVAERINDCEISDILSSVLKLTRFNYQFKINSVIYSSKSSDDESQRMDAISEIRHPVISTQNNSFKVKKLIPVLSLTKIMRG